ncbi:hypothetical protein [Streptomyces sp. CC208A]|uniref:hypothetical protein n=1 Tax=Streptomyces sp. CC208A TaxID=3044573 RepID=UPI0024A7BC3D|nr:hypothetical protein [Streptomyces sp. CC208A]
MFDLIVIIDTKTPEDIAPVADALTRMRPVCLAEDGCVRSRCPIDLECGVIENDCRVG